jgi:hypothetical protein
LGFEGLTAAAHIHLNGPKLGVLEELFDEEPIYIAVSSAAGGIDPAFNPISEVRGLVLVLDLLAFCATTKADFPAIILFAQCHGGISSFSRTSTGRSTSTASQFRNLGLAGRRLIEPL